MKSVSQYMANAYRSGRVIPAFNVPYLPMIKPIIEAVAAQNSFALIEVARLEWEKFESISLEAVKKECDRWFKPDHVRLHLDHVPVIDEDNKDVDYMSIITRALDCGYHSVMIDGSRLDFKDNVRVTQKVVDLAYKYSVPCEAELGAVFGHEKGPLPPYEELFNSGRGFTDTKEAEQFVALTGCDWLSVAIGNIHGSVSKTLRDKKKIQACLNIEHLKVLSEVTRIPLVLHGGTGIKKQDLIKAFSQGISKLNVGTELRQTYEQAMRETKTMAQAQQALYKTTYSFINDLGCKDLGAEI